MIAYSLAGFIIINSDIFSALCSQSRRFTLARPNNYCQF